MEIIRDPQHLQKLLTSMKKSIGFVPTMGALHEGHFSLVQKSKKENDLTVVSIFVNPTQFNNPDDFKKYPQSLEKDAASLNDLGVDFLFYPTFESLYPDNYAYSIEEKEQSTLLCGASRPGHFAGVLTIVLKLLHIVNPQKAYFGEKDFQQLSLIQKMVTAFFLPVEIISVPTVRDQDGLALSSRNQRLSEKGLDRARRFAKILKQNKPVQDIKNDLINLDIQVDYLEEHAGRRFAAVYIDDVRLIDNVPL